MKKILMLGGSRYIIPVIKAAHELGYYVITCDYLPNNIGHKYSDEYHNVSIIEKDSVLGLAQKLDISGVMSFACDPGVTTAAYVAERLGLPGHPYKSVMILQNKDLFRKFLTGHGFNVPKASGYSDKNKALADYKSFKLPVMVKPVDSAGSKGVTRVDSVDNLPCAIDTAIEHSIRKDFIIEEFIEKQGFSSDTDCFSVNGKLVYASYCNQRFDENAENPYAPSAYSWPSSMPDKIQKELSTEIQRLLSLLNMRTSIYNIETRMGIDGKGYIMEVSPRGGGNRLAEVLQYATGADLIKNAVRASVGEAITEITGPHYNGYWAEVILHGSNEGNFQRLDIADSLRKYIFEEDLWVVNGEQIHTFSGANEAIGTLVLKFDSQEELISKMSMIDEEVKVITL